MSDHAAADFTRLFVRVRPFLGQEATVPDRDDRAGFPAVEVRYAHESGIGLPVSPKNHSGGTADFRKGPNADQPRRIVCVLDPLNTYRIKARYDYMDEAFGSGLDDACKVAATQSEVYHAIGKTCFGYFQDGINSSIVAYGAASTGKSHTMFGPLQLSNSSATASRGAQGSLLTEQCGLVPRLIASALEWGSKKKNIMLTLTGVAVVMERIYDIFAEPNAVVELRLRDDGRGPFLQNLAHVAIPLEADEDPHLFLRRVYKILHRILYAGGIGGMKPHVVITLNAEQTFEFAEGQSTLTKRRFSRITLVDIAGSGSAGSTSDTIQLSPQDIAKNNKAMFTFKRCIEALGEDPGKPSARPPFRDSVFTWLLSDILGGNCVTNLLLCVSPFHRHVIDSSTTLALGIRARSIAVAARVNEDEETVKLREMQNEMENVAKQITVVNNAVAHVTDQLRERGERIDRLAAVDAQLRAMLEHEMVQFESEKMMNAARRLRLTRRLERENQECQMVDRHVEQLRERVQFEQDAKQTAEKVLREKEHARFRECGVEQDFLTVFQEVQGAIDTIDKNERHTRLATEKHHTRKSNYSTEISQLQTELSTKRIGRDQRKEDAELSLERYNTKMRNLEEELNVLRKEKESCVGVHQFNSTATQEAKDVIAKLESEIAALNAKKLKLEREREELKSGCNCIIA